MKHLYFCRHGLSQLNADGRWAGQIETPLTDEGREQAKAAGVSAKDLHIDYILSSPLSRAHETAMIIAKEIGFPVDKIELNSLVLERHFGSLEGTPWQPDFNMDGIADAETRDSILERGRLTLEHLKNLPVDTILVVSHGAFGRALRHAIDPSIPFQGSPGFKNAEIVKLI